MDIHDLKIFLMIAQGVAVDFRKHVQEMAAKRYAQERLHDKKKVDK